VSKNQNQFAPIALFAYNRPWHLRQTVEALLENREAAQSDLYIFSDGARNDEAVEAVGQVRQYIKIITGFKSLTMIERPENYGLGKSIIEGVTFVCNKFNKVIVLEDDLVTSHFFLKFMNDGLNCYESEERVASIHGYMYPVTQALPQTFFVRGADCLGWATWKRAWELFEPDGQKLYDELQRSRLTDHFDLDGAYPFTQMLKDQIAGKNNSWAVRWHASIFLENKLTLYPQKSFVKHIGNDGSGTNFGANDMLDTELAERPVIVGEIPIVESLEARSAVAQYLAPYCAIKKTSLLRRAIQKVVGVVKRWLQWGGRN
jgi:hypothetical protein